PLSSATSSGSTVNFLNVRAETRCPFRLATKRLWPLQRAGISSTSESEIRRRRVLGSYVMPMGAGLGVGHTEVRETRMTCPWSACAGCALSSDMMRGTHTTKRIARFMFILRGQVAGRHSPAIFVSNPTIPRSYDQRSDPYDGSSCSSTRLDAAINRRRVKFFDRSAGGRPTLGSEDQSHTPQTTTWMSPWRVVVRSSSDPHSGHRSGASTM